MGTVRLVRVLDGAKLSKPLDRDPKVGDFPHLGINVRAHAPGKAIVHNTGAPDGVRIGDRTLYVTQNAVVDVPSDVVTGTGTFRVIF
jgi:hypothetical protein